MLMNSTNTNVDGGGWETVAGPAHCVDSKTPPHVSMCAWKTPTCFEHVGVLPSHTDTFLRYTRRRSLTFTRISTMRPEIISSNDFDRFRFFFGVFEFEFCRRGKLFPNNNSNLLCVWSSFTHYVTFTCTCVVACFHTCVDQVRTHSGKKRER